MLTLLLLPTCTCVAESLKQLEAALTAAGSSLANGAKIDAYVASSADARVVIEAVEVGLCKVYCLAFVSWQLWLSVHRYLHLHGCVCSWYVYLFMSPTLVLVDTVEITKILDAPGRVVCLLRLNGSRITGAAGLCRTNAWPETVAARG